MSSRFSPEFVWGVATAAFQIEGAVVEDGRGESIWDRFCATPGKVWNGHDGSVACDFYHRYPADVALMGELGIDAFRFSIAWPRILPEGVGQVNTAGLDFYDRLVEALLEHDITPYPTLYHWDLPQPLQDRGGWAARETAAAFAEYTEIVLGRLADRIDRWATINEPWVIAWLGHGWGTHAPGLADRRQALAAGHHVLLAHALASEVIRRDAGHAEVGIVLDLTPAYPATDAPADRAAALHADGFHNRWFLDPLFRGRYPVDLLEHFGAAAPPVEDGDLELISAPFDFLGVNNYTRRVVRANPAGGDPVEVRPHDARRTTMGWEVYPEGLHDLLVRLRDDYAPPAIYVMENGAAFEDVREHDGLVRDPERQAYLTGYIDAVGAAVAEGVPVKGYFVWSLLDNFEWAEGYGKRFGLVYVDYPTLDRIPKSSFFTYRDFILAQRAPGSVTAAAAPG